MADNNLAQSSISAEEIHEMANAAREMANNFNDANKELSTTIGLLNKMNKLTGRTSSSGAAGKTTTASNKATKHASSTSSALRSESEQILSQLTGGKFGRVANKLKFGPIVAVLTAVISVARKLVQTGEQLRKTYGNAQKDLSALGQTSSNLNTYMQTDAKALADLQSKTHALGAVFGAVGNIIKSTVEKVANSLLDLVPQMEELEKSLAGVNRRQSIASAQMQLIGQGMKYGAAGTTASNIEAAAVAYLKSAYGYSDTEARNSSDYASAVEAMTSLVTSGGQSGMFNTANVQGYGYANQIWQPGVHYTDAYMTAMRSQMLSDALSVYQEQGAEGLADWNNNMAKIQTLVGNIANSLYSFDEVEQLNATNLEDLDASVQELGTNEESISNVEQNNDDKRKDQLIGAINDVGNRVTAGADQVAAAVNVPAPVVNVDVQPAPVYVNATAPAVQPQPQTQTQTSTIGARANATTAEQAQAARRAAEQAAARQTQAARVGDGSTIGAPAPDFTAIWQAYDALEAYINSSYVYKDDYYRKDYLQQLKSGIQSLTTQQQINEGAAAITAEMQRLQQFATTGTLNAIAEGLDGRNMPDWMRNWLGAYGAGAGLLGGAGAGAGALSAAGGLGAYLQQLMPSMGFATGGIGTSKVTNATLFENGPEAVIPLTSDIGKTFMAESISQALDLSYAGGDTINVHIDGPVFTENERQLNQWAEKLGDRFIQIQARRGGK